MAHRPAEIDLALEHGIDRVEKSLRTVKLADIADGSGLHRARREDRILVHREHQDARRRTVVAQSPQDVEAAGAAQAEIEYDQIGVMPGAQLQAFGAAAGLDQVDRATALQQ